MPKVFKKFVFSFLTVLIVLFSFAPYFSPAKAQTWYSQDPFEWYLKVYDTNTSPTNEIFGERYTAAQVQWVTWSFLFMPIRMFESVLGENTITCLMKGFGTGTADITTCAKGLGDVIGGIIGKILPNPIAYNNKPFLASVFDSNGREISGIGYSQNLLRKFSPVSVVNAQGFGFSGLNWVQTYWRGFRDISYALLVLVVIVFAFMIMFRVKLSPQTVISVQSALPKVIVAMVLITFSYAIAGFAVDLMYVVSGIFALLLKYAGFSTNLNGAFGVIAGTGWGYQLAGGLWIFFMMLGYSVAFFVAAAFSFFTTLLSSLNIFGAILALVFVVMTVWVLILMLWYTIKIPLMLFKTVISMYLSIITAPIQILAGTISPSMGFGAWFKRLMADVLVFPMVGLLFWFAWYFLGQSFAVAGNDFTTSWSTVFQFLGATPAPVPWVPGIVANTAFNVPGVSGLLFLAMSFGIIVLIPKVPDLMKSIFMGEKFSYGTAMGEAWGAVGSAYGASGLKDRVGMFKATAQKEQLRDFAEKYNTNNAGWLSQRISSLENNRFVGKTVKNTMENIKKGATREH